MMNNRIELWPEGAPLAQGDGAEDRPAITPYLADSAKSGEAVPAIVILPGGGYEFRASDHEGDQVARWVNSLGLHAFVVDYRVAPYQHPAPLLDAKRALRTVRANAAAWNVDPNRVGILGFSAGGHLASSAGTHYDHGQADAADPIERFSSRPDFMILCYPVITMGEYTHGGSRANLLGDQPDEELVRLMSNELQVTSDTPPTFIWHTSDDEAVPVENSLLFASALRRARVPVEFHSFMTGHHGLGLAHEHPEAKVWPELCARWLARLGIARDRN